MSFCVSKNAIKYEKGAAVVNTTSIVKARGFQGKTPVKIYIRNGKVQKIVALPNQDTPSVFAQAETLLKLSPVLSRRTILEHLPWVTDPEEELRRIEKEEQR